MRSLALALAVLLGGGGWGAATAGERVDLELVLAVDASGSVDAREFALQLGGIAAGFLDGEVHEAVRSGPEQRIAVALMIWSDAAFPKVKSGWFLVDGPASATAFARAVKGYGSQRGASIGKSGAGTGIGAALEHALLMLHINDIDAPRRTVDISGDGVETKPWFNEAMELPAARRLALADKVVVNGLAILSDNPRLGAYYRDEVIAGPGSFVMTADGFEDFAEAMKRKLLAEIEVVVGMR